MLLPFWMSESWNKTKKLSQRGRYEFLYCHWTVPLRLSSQRTRSIERGFGVWSSMASLTVAYFKKVKWMSLANIRSADDPPMPLKVHTPAEAWRFLCMMQDLQSSNYLKHSSSRCHIKLQPLYLMFNLTGDSTRNLIWDRIYSREEIQPWFEVNDVTVERSTVREENPILNIFMIVEDSNP